MSLSRIKFMASILEDMKLQSDGEDILRLLLSRLHELLETSLVRFYVYILHSYLGYLLLVNIMKQ